ncbi:hypothetical protein SAMN02745664_11655 [Moraxella cuniculi DSM 21768]|uniref:A nuclease family of the HNH/ENDO VII superfamily with conserved AHH n=1 Tax=Moraxella cuniculi DSM 21768 TaxID=1122245 RepID=A0A1N7FSB7_9GAMM|nr:hypothetical protein [Moraxella cuniculi]OOS08342.1 hypothetical protein B0189_00020 [Moraxella cuniculi]SIS03239.1 hypothetical protein SAMN02745664_11655 [Moraxella cuniculi DSM 21768]
MGIAPRKKGNTTGKAVGQTKPTNKSAKKANPALTKQELDDLQALIGLLGFLPGLGIGADLVNAAISAIRGDFAGALFDLFSAIPIIGDAGKGAKVIKDIDKYLGVINRLQATVIKKIPNKTIANKLQKVLNEAKEELNKQKLNNKKPKPAKTSNNKKPQKKTQKDSTVKPKPKLKCGQSGTYKDLKKSTGDNKYDRDHIPSKAALKKRAAELKGDELTKEEAKAIDDAGWTIAIPKQAHKDASPTYGNKNKNLIQKDANDLAGAAQRDIKAMRDKIGKYDKGCAKKYRTETNKILKKTNADYDRMLENILETFSKQKR